MFLQVVGHILHFFAIFGTDQKLTPLQPATPITSSVVHQNFCSFLSLRRLLSYYSRDTFLKRKISKFENKNSLVKNVPLLYGEKFPFCSGVLKENLQIILEKQKSSLFCHGLIRQYLRNYGVIPIKGVTPFLYLSGFFRFFLFYSFHCINKLLLC